MSSLQAASPILIVDDDLLFRDALRSSLSQKNFSSEAVGNASLGRNIIELQQPSLVITDIRMPGESGLDFFEWIKAHHPTIPVILISGFADAMAGVEMANAGMAAFLAKPFRQEDLFSTIERLLAQKKSFEPAPPTAEQLRKEEEEDHLYCKISIEDFILGSQIRHSVYIRIPRGTQGRYLKIAHSGEDLSLERIAAYKAKGVSHLYLEKEDYQAYVGLNVLVAGLATKSEKISVEKKTRFVRHTMELVNQQMSGLNVSRQDFDNAATLVETTVDLLTSNDNGYSLLESLRNISDSFYAHGAAVSMICTLVGRKLGWTSPKALYKASMAGLLHDIGKKQIPKEILNKKRSEMDAEEFAIYELHPQRGMEILSDLGFIPSEVIQAVYQHHERSMGTGFPNKVTENRIIPLAKIVGAVDEFVNVLFPDGQLGSMPVAAALERVSTFHGSSLSKDMVKALYEAFSLPPPQKR